MRCSIKQLWVALLGSLVVLIGVSPVTSALADDGKQPIKIDNGYVTWGIKKSWRHYIGSGGTHLEGGLQQLDAESDGTQGAFVWPIKTGTYDPRTKTTVLKLAGVAHFQAYPESGGKFLLDSTWKDLVLTISSDRQVIEGTYVGRPRSNPGGSFEETHGVLAELNIKDRKPVTVASRTVWNSIPTTAGTAMVLYPATSEIDPVSIMYAGSGGKPVLPNTFSEYGAPKYLKSEQWRYPDVMNSDGGKAAPQIISVFPSPVNHSIATVGYSENGSKMQFYLLSSKDLKLLGKSEYTLNDRVNVISTSAFDPVSLTIFFVVKDFRSGHYSDYVKLFAASWDARKKSFIVGKVTDMPAGRGGDTFSNFGGIFAWNPRSRELWWSESVQPKQHPEHGGAAYMWVVSRSGGTWKIVKKNIKDAPSAPKHLPLSAAQIVSSGGSNYDSNVFLSNSELVTAPNRYVSVPSDNDSVQYPYPLLKVTQGADGDFRVAYLEATVGKPFNGIDTERFGFGDIGYLKDYGLFASGDSGSGGVQFADPVGVRKPVDVDPLPGSVKGPTGVAVDAKRGYFFTLLYYINRVLVYSAKSKAQIASFDIPGNSHYSSTVFSVDSGSVFVLTGRDHALIEKYVYQTSTAKVISEPEDVTVKANDASAKLGADFAVDYSSEGNATVQWQSRPVGERLFKPIPGATGKKLHVDVTSADAGTHYRAVIKNAAGLVASREAVLKVVTPPQFLSAPVSMRAYRGDSVSFTASVSPDFPGDLSWEVKNGSGWVPVKAGDGVKISEDPAFLQVVATRERDGAVYRAVLKNGAGTTASDPVSLSVLDPVKIPPQGQRIHGVTFRWGMANLFQERAASGGYHYFSAGVSDGTPKTFKATDGNVGIWQVIDGKRSQPTASTIGAYVKKGGRQYVELTGGEAVVKPDGSKTVSWKGSWTVNMYSGLVPFAISDPVLSLDKDGNGQITATMTLIKEPDKKGAGEATAPPASGSGEGAATPAPTSTEGANGAASPAPAAAPSSTATPSPAPAAKPSSTGAAEPAPAANKPSSGTLSSAVAAAPAPMAVTGLLSLVANEVRPDSKPVYSPAHPYKVVKDVTIATFKGARIDPLNRVQIEPEYVLVKVDAPKGFDPQKRPTGSFSPWGSWPQSWVDFHGVSGLASYFYTSGADNDSLKYPSNVGVDFSKSKADPVPAAPVVKKQPVAVKVEAGQSAAFVAEAAGVPTPTVQWQSKQGADPWTNIPGATATTLEIAKADVAQSGIQYRAVFTNSEGTATSQGVTLTVTKPAPKPPVQPQPGSGNTGKPDVTPKPGEQPGKQPGTLLNPSTGAGQAPAAGVDQGRAPGKTLAQATVNGSVNASQHAQAAGSGAGTVAGKNLAATGSEFYNALFIASLLVIAGAVMVTRKHARSHNA